MHVKLGELGGQKRALDPLGLECLDRSFMSWVLEPLLCSLQEKQVFLTN